jgi:predicted permease
VSNRKFNNLSREKPSLARRSRCRGGAVAKHPLKYPATNAVLKGTAVGKRVIPGRKVGIITRHPSGIDRQSDTPAPMFWLSTVTRPAPNVCHRPSTRNACTGWAGKGRFVASRDAKFTLGAYPIRNWFVYSTMSDFKFAFRQFQKSPGFAATVILTISLGIGANTAIFTLVHAILLKNLPVANPASLYRIGDLDDCCVNGGFINDNGDFDLFSYDLYRHLQNTTPEFEQLAAFESGQGLMNVRVGDSLGKAERTEYVSGNYFATFGVGAYAGRMFQASDDLAGAAPVAVISYSAWQASHASDRNVVGSTFFIQSHPVTIVGIAPPDFFGDRINENPPAFWIPLNAEPALEGETSILKVSESNWLYVLGRLKPGIAPKALEAKISASLRQWLATQSAYTQNGNDKEIPKQHVILTPGGGGVQDLQIRTGDGLRLLVWISALVLLVACANIANLLLARGTARGAETSIRTALGASRSALIRQLLVESVLLSVTGGIIGIAIAYLGARLILTLAFPNAMQMPIQTNPSPVILGFAFVLSLRTGVIFGIVPAWISSHANPAEALRGMNRSTGDRSLLPQKALIVLQASLSLVLLVGAGLMTETLRNLEHQKLGIATANRYVIHFDPMGAGYNLETIGALNQRIEDAFKALPGVKSAGLALYSTLEGNNWGEAVFVEGRPAPGPEERHGSSWDRVSPQFFETVGQPVIRGRGFTDQDTATSAMVAVVNQAFVKKFFPKEDPIGHHFGTFDQKYASSYEIVGIVADAKYTNPRDPVPPMYFRPMTQFNRNLTGRNFFMAESRSVFPNSITVQYAGDASSLESSARRTLASINPDLTVVNFRSLDSQVADNFNQERLISRLTGLFGLLALILASIGLYGITAYSVARRTNEIGVRMALGANRGQVIALVMRRALLLVAVGLAVGIPVALAGGYWIRAQLYDVTAHDPATFILAVLVLAAFAALAGFIPARRASSIEPMRALRIE